jgi:dolichol kinase
MIGRTEVLANTKFVRNIWHCAAGVVLVILYGLVSREEAQAALNFALFAFALLEGSRMVFPRWNDYLVDKALRYLFRQSERNRLNTSLWYLLGLITIVFFFSKQANQIAILILAIGDPAAAIVGQLYGKTKIFRGKSVEGSITFLGVAFACSLIYILCLGNTTLPAAIAGAIVIAMASCATELFTVKIDDNFSIPVISAAVASFFV